MSERVALSLRALGPAGEAWLAGLPRLLAGLAAEWSITLGARLDGGRTAYVAEATTHDGTPAVLGVSIPGSDFDRQLQALQLAGGDPYARLVRHDVPRRALLLERLGRPGPFLAMADNLAEGTAKPELLLMVGLPGAGKSTRAAELAVAHRALRLTPDEWMIPLFGEPEAGGKRDVLEGRLITVALQALRLGTSVVLDFGLWSRDERSALRRLAATAGASSRVIYLPVDRDVQRARIAHRQATAPHTTFPMIEADLDRWRTLFQAPDAAELRYDAPVPTPPPGWPGWPEWAAHRWPSLDTAAHRR
ncbi:ATP-binding protein [Dactylosporangium sp. NPDC049140]|uniref:AAA family ATPase n=1 Tax=Dactylosporangium sp. NPDC049140 TaxID=3155647 RepID=UPI0033C81C3E